MKRSLCRGVERSGIPAEGCAAGLRCGTAAEPKGSDVCVPAFRFQLRCSQALRSTTQKFGWKNVGIFFLKIYIINNYLLFNKIKPDDQISQNYTNIKNA